MINANQPKVQHQPCISSAGLTQGHQPVHRCALAWQGVDHRTAKRNPTAENHRSWQSGHTTNLNPATTVTFAPQPQAAPPHMSLSTTAGPGPDEPAIVVQSRRAHTSSLPRPGPFPTSSSRELTQPMVQCKVKAAITTYQRQEKEKCVSSCDSASCSTNGTKVASSPFLIFGTPTLLVALPSSKEPEHSS